MNSIDLLIFGQRQGKIQMIDAILGIPNHIDSLKLGTDDFGNKLVPVPVPEIK